MGEGSGMRSRGDKRRLATGGRIGMKGESLILPKVWSPKTSSEQAQKTGKVHSWV